MLKTREKIWKPIHRVHIVRHARKPVVAILDIDDYEDLLEAANPRIRRELTEARQDIAAGRTISHAALKEQLGL